MSSDAGLNGNKWKPDLSDRTVEGRSTEDWGTLHHPSPCRLGQMAPPATPPVLRPKVVRERSPSPASELPGKLFGAAGFLVLRQKVR